MKTILYILFFCFVLISCTKDEEKIPEPLPPKVNVGICGSVVLFNVQTVSLNQSISIKLQDCGAAYQPLDSLWIEHSANNNTFIIPNGIVIYSFSASGITEITFSDPELNLLLDPIHDSILVKDSTKTYGHYFY